MRYKRNNCHECKTNPRSGQRNCRSCHAAYLRAWRKLHKQTPEQRRRQNARRYALVYFKRGKIKHQPCPCGETNSQMHHEDYNKPLEVIWLCRPCHLSLHKKQRQHGP